MGEGVKNVSVIGCTFESLGGNGIFISKYARDVDINDNIFASLGESAVMLAGEMANGTSRGVAYPSKVSVTQNMASQIGLYNKQSSCYFQAISPQNRYERNVCFEGPRMGIMISDGFGGGTTIADNLVFSMVRETSDSAPMHSWDRMPYFTDLGVSGSWGVVPKWSYMEGNFILNNGAGWFPSNSHGRFVWEPDDGSGWYHINSNVFAYGTTGSWVGHDMRIWNNLLVRVELSGTDDPTVDSPTCIWSGFTSTKAHPNNTYMENTCITAPGDIYTYLQYFQPGDNNMNEELMVPPPFVHAKCDPALMPRTAWPAQRNHFLTSNASGVSINCGNMWSWTLHEWQTKLGFDLGSTQGPMPSADEVAQMIASKLQLGSHSVSVFV